MCYLIAKKSDEEGCLAVQSEYGKTLSALVTYLTLKTLGKGIEILTVSDMDTFGEYKPYHLIESEALFIQKVLSM